MQSLRRAEDLLQALRMRPDDVPVSMV